MSKKDIKNILIILAICAAATVAGFFFGRGASFAENNGFDLKTILAENKNQIMAVLTIVYIVLSAVTFLVTYLYIALCRNTAKHWDGEDEDVIRKLESRMNVPMIVSTVMMVLNMLLMPICFLRADIGPDMDISYMVKVTVLFFVNYIWIIASNEMVVRLEKKLNPEKRGSVLELNFQKHWESGLDEAEKFITYKAAYKSMKITNWSCIGLWLAAFLGMIMLDTGVWPLIMVCAVWLILSLTYMIETMKLER